MGTGIQTSVFKLLQMMKYNMSLLMDTSELKFLYEKHDPNLVKERCADVIDMHKYIGPHKVDVAAGIALTCKELHKRATEWESHNG